MSLLYTADVVTGALSYSSYRHTMRQTLRLPAGDVSAESLLRNTRANIGIMNRVDGAVRLSPALCMALQKAPRVTWLVISEGWCGDAAYSLPLFAAIENAFAQKITLRIVLRDSHPDLINANLTNGGKSIPILIALDSNRHKLAVWGPRPQPLQRLINKLQGAGRSIPDLIPDVHQWYTNDNTATLQEEIRRFVESYS